MPKRHAPYRIVVAGAGPVGLLFAALCDRLFGPDVRMRIVDARPPAPWLAEDVDARVYALSRESQCSLTPVWPGIAAKRISPYRRMRVFEGDGPDARSAIDFDAADIGEPNLGHIVEDSLLRTALIDHLQRDRVELVFGNGIDGFEPRRAGVRVVYGDGSAEDAHLLVGADGADSRVRAAAGIEVVRKDYEQRAIVTHVATGKPHAATAWQRFLPGGPLAFLPLADGRSSVVWTNGSAEAERLLALPDAGFLAELDAASAGILGRLGPCTPRLAFGLEFKHAVRYQGPGVVLIGDAAHAVHPLAGQGMNLGLRDAAVLAQTLAAALGAGEYPGDELVLRRYARAQRAHNLAMQLVFDGLNALFGKSLGAWTAPLRGLGMAAVDSCPAAKRLLMRRAMGFDRPIPGPGLEARSA